MYDQIAVERVDHKRQNHRAFVEQQLFELVHSGLLLSTYEAKNKIFSTVEQSIYKTLNSPKRMQQLNYNTPMLSNNQQMRTQYLSAILPQL